MGLTEGESLTGEKMEGGEGRIQGKKAGKEEEASKEWRKQEKELEEMGTKRMGKADVHSPPSPSPAKTPKRTVPPHPPSPADTDVQRHP